MLKQGLPWTLFGVGPGPRHFGHNLTSVWQVRRLRRLRRLPISLSFFAAVPVFQGVARDCWHLLFLRTFVFIVLCQLLFAISGKDAVDSCFFGRGEGSSIIAARVSVGGWVVDDDTSLTSLVIHRERFVETYFCVIANIPCDRTFTGVEFRAVCFLLIRIMVQWRHFLQTFLTAADGSGVLIPARFGGCIFQGSVGLVGVFVLWALMAPGFFNSH